MTGKIDEILQYLADVDSRLHAIAEQQPGMFSDSAQEISQCSHSLRNKLDSAELLIPVVGAFSAGKSTLINRTLGVKYLPEGISPETAIPTELRYAVRERIEAVYESGKIEEYALDEIDQLTARAGEYEYARLYADNPQLRACSPFVLVDMPGFNSPHDAHNEAILRYLRRGAHYLFLASVEEGGIQRQEIRRMDEVLDMGRDFSVVITKCDLKPQGDVDELQKYVEDQLATSFAKDDPCLITGDRAGSTLALALTGLNHESILLGINKDALLNFYFMVDGALNSAIDALGNEEEENRRALSELRKGIEAIEQEKQESIRKAKAKAAGDRARRIVSAVENELRNSTDELARAAAADQSAFGRVLSDAVRSRVSRELQATTAELGHNLAVDISHSIQVSIPSLRLSEDWFDHIVDTIKGQVMDATIGVGEANSLEKQGDGMVGGRLAHLGAMIAASVPHPVMKVVLAVLPGIVGSLLDAMAEQRREERIKEQISSAMIPDVLRQIRPVVDDAMLTISEQVISAISAEFNDLLTDKVEAIEALQNQSEMDSAVRSELLEQLVACKQVNDEYGLGLLGSKEHA